MISVHIYIQINITPITPKIILTIISLYILIPYNFGNAQLTYLLLTFIKTFEPQLILRTLTQSHRNIGAQRLNCLHGCRV